MVFGGEQAYSSARPEPVSRHQRPDRERDGDASCENDRQGGCSVYLGRVHAVSAGAGRKRKSQLPFEEASGGKNNFAVNRRTNKFVEVSSATSSRHSVPFQNFAPMSRMISPHSRTASV